MGDEPRVALVRTVVRNDRKAAEVKMSEISSNPIIRKAHVSMMIVCPRCGQKMVLHVGLIGVPKDNSVECVGCRNSLIPLVPGPIVGGPFVD